jgi:hypothetical protein
MQWLYGHPEQEQRLLKGSGEINKIWTPLFLKHSCHCQWLIAQLLEGSLSVMKDPGSNIGADMRLSCY